MRHSEIHGNKAGAPPEAVDATAAATRAAVGDNERATRLSGVCSWQAITVPYIISSGLALLYIGLIKAPSLSLAEPLVLPSVPAAVGGGTSISGGRGGSTIIGALILTRNAVRSDSHGI